MATAWSAYGDNVIDLDPPITADRILDDEATWTPSEERMLAEMVQHGLSHIEMGISLQRTTAAISNKLHRIRNRAT
jgi:hypothetical protein